jgi:cyclopropane fatty-acyl-phospholipid synthase-like methyltransferase
MSIKQSIALDNRSAICGNEENDSLKAARTVCLCYGLTNISVFAGVEDYTEGIYNGNPGEDFSIAQKRQHHYLLDELGAEPGYRLLEIGCGLGTLLETASERKIDATGITISKDQWKVCRSKNLPVFLSDYRKLPAYWNGRFDGIIVNGALEHFCQPADAIKGHQNQIYSDMFRIFSSLLDRDSPSRKLVTTALHFRGRHVNPEKLIKSPVLQVFDKTGFHYSILHRGYGGYYPVSGQLAGCAKDIFSLIKEVDGTQDYGFTADDWLKKFRHALFTGRFAGALARHFFHHPVHTFWFVMSFIGPASQLWQFRGQETPVQHFRHTWQAL